MIYGYSGMLILVFFSSYLHFSASKDIIFSFLKTIEQSNMLVQIKKNTLFLVLLASLCYYYISALDSEYTSPTTKVIFYEQRQSQRDPQQNLPNYFETISSLSLNRTVFHNRGWDSERIFSEEALTHKNRECISPPLKGDKNKF